MQRQFQDSSCFSGDTRPDLKPQIAVAVWGTTSPHAPWTFDLSWWLSEGITQRIISGSRVLNRYTHTGGFPHRCVCLKSFTDSCYAAQSALVWQFWGLLKGSPYTLFHGWHLALASAARHVVCWNPAPDPGFLCFLHWVPSVHSPSVLRHPSSSQPFPRNAEGLQRGKKLITVWSMKGANTQRFKHATKNITGVSAKMVSRPIFF